MTRTYVDASLLDSETALDIVRAIGERNRIIDDMRAALQAFIDAHAPDYVSAMADDSERNAYDEAYDAACAALGAHHNANLRKEIVK